MEIYALKHAISEIKREINSAWIDNINFSDSELIDFAFKALMLDEMKALNKNFERFNDFNNSKR